MPHGATALESSASVTEWWREFGDPTYHWVHGRSYYNRSLGSLHAAPHLGTHARQHLPIHDSQTSHPWLTGPVSATCALRYVQRTHSSCTQTSAGRARCVPPQCKPVGEEFLCGPAQLVFTLAVFRQKCVRVVHDQWRIRNGMDQPCALAGCVTYGCGLATPLQN